MVDDFQVELVEVPGLGKRVQAAVTVSIFNPSDVTSPDLGQLAVALEYMNETLGTLVADRPALESGWNKMSLTGLILPDGGDENKLAMLEELVTRYMQGELIPVSATATATPSDKPLFAALLSSLTLATTIQGMRVGVAMEAIIELTRSQAVSLATSCLPHPKSCRLPTIMRFRNPFVAPVLLHKVRFYVMSNGSHDAISEVTPQRDLCLIIDGPP
jgi:hypothetical protein